MKKTADEEDEMEPKEYLVEVRSVFEAKSPEDAVNQMVSWLYEAAGSTMYGVLDLVSNEHFLIDAEDSYYGGD